MLQTMLRPMTFGLRRLAAVAGNALSVDSGAVVEALRRSICSDMAQPTTRRAWQVDEDRKLEPALPRPDVGDIAHPGLIRAAGMKGSGKDVWRNLELMIRVRWGLKAALAGATRSQRRMGQATRMRLQPRPISCSARCTRRLPERIWALVWAAGTAASTLAVRAFRSFCRRSRQR